MRITARPRRRERGSNGEESRRCLDVWSGSQRLSHAWTWRLEWALHVTSFNSALDCLRSDARLSSPGLAAVWTRRDNSSSR